MTQRLEMIFRTAGGRRATIAVIDPQDNLDAATVQNAMNAIITKNIFAATTGDLVGIIGARIVSRDTVELISME